MTASTLEVTIVDQFDLFCKENGSNKIYRGRLVQTESGWIVTYIHHAVVKPPITGAKTPDPVDEASARKIYASLLKEKLKKGYKPLDGQTDDPVYQTISGRKMVGYALQFSTPVSAEDAEIYLSDDNVLAQLKANGEYRTLNKVTDLDGTVHVFGGNSNSEQVPLQQPVVQALLAHPAPNLEIHAEDMGDHMVAFDLTRDATGDLRELTVETRYAKLLRLVPDLPFLRLVECASGTADKRALLGRVIDAALEGIIFKYRFAPYTPGKAGHHRSASHIKYKLKEQCFAVVSAHTKGKRSVRLSVFDETMAPVDVGSVTIPPNYEVPPVGVTVEVEYLYVTNVGGGLKEPVYKGRRDDVELPKCSVSQLKYHGQGTAS